MIGHFQYQAEWWLLVGYYLSIEEWSWRSSSRCKKCHHRLRSTKRDLVPRWIVLALYCQIFTLKAFVKDWDDLKGIENAVESVDKVISNLASWFFIYEHYHYMLVWVTVDADLMIFFRVVVLASRCFVLYWMLQFFEGAKGICGKINATAFDLGWLKDEFTQGTEIAFTTITIAEGMSHTVAP